jgi:hypothetical protein
VAIANVDSVAIGPYSLGISRGTGEDQVVAGKIERRESERIEQKIETVVTSHPRKILHP